jgi:hypothetical protein
MLVVLKIPIVYLCAVVWWAIRAEPRPEEPAALVPVVDGPRGAGTPDRRRSQSPRRRPPSGPARRPHSRVGAVRAEARR